MQFSAILVSLLAAVAAAAPVEIEERQSSNVGTTANEYTRYGCRKVIFFFARGSTEIGNMVSLSFQIQPQQLTNLQTGFHRRSTNR